MAEIPMSAQAYEGRGINGTTGKLFGVAIEFDAPSSITTGQSTIFELVSISNSRELTETLNISASASFKKGLGGASAAFSLAQSRQFNNYYTYALVRVFVVNPPLLLRNPRLRPVAQNMLVSQGWDAFATAYGWEYVEGYITGGSYYALIEIQTTNEREQRDIKGKLSGFYGPFSASAGVESTLKDISRNTTTNVFVSQSGGKEDPVEISLDAMLAQAKDFPKTASQHPVPIIALTVDYQSTVPLPPVPGPNSLGRTQQRNVMEDLGRGYLKLRDYKANLEFILEHLFEFDDFRDLDAQQLQSKRQEYQGSLDATADEIDEVVKRAMDCADNFNQCPTYVPNIQNLPLPKIGGDLMNLKQLEEHLNDLRKEVETVKQTANTAIQGKLQGLEAAGNIGFGGDTISTPGRMHITGEELLFLLNKHGVIIGKHWGGNGNLTVEGEIQGKLWFSGEFTTGMIPGNGTQVSKKMLPADRCFAFVTSISGDLKGGGERVWVEIRSDGHWYLCATGHGGGIEGRARCAGMPS